MKGSSRLRGAERARPQPASGSIRKHVEDFAPAVQLLHAMPEVDAEQLLVMLQECFELVVPEPEEGPELLGEDISLADVKPRFLRGLLRVAARLGQQAEVAVRERRQLVVGVEDKAAVPYPARLRAGALELSELRVREPAPLERRLLELLRVDQTARPVVAEHQA